MSESFEQGLQRIAESYQFWNQWGEARSAAAFRKEIKAVKSAAQKLAKAMESCDDKTMTTLRAIVEEHLGFGSLDRAKELVAGVRMAAADAHRRIPMRFHGGARQLAADELRALFEHHQKAFTAYASSYGDVSEAVECLTRIVPGLDSDVARKLIEETKKRK